MVMIKAIFIIVLLFTGLGFTSFVNPSFATTNTSNTQLQDSQQQLLDNSNSIDNDDTGTTLSPNTQDEPQSESPPAQQQTPPSQNLVEQSTEIEASGTTDEIVEQIGNELDKILDTPGVQPSSISIKCTVSYPPLIITCTIDWLSSDASDNSPISNTGVN